MKTITRRQFITTSSQATAVIAAGSAVLGFPTISRAQSPGDQIVLALIGAGGRAAAHASGLSRLPGVEFKYVCDIWKDRGAGIMQDLEKVQKRAPKRIADMRAALDDKEVNAVVIDPDKWHQPNFVDCLRTRKQPNGDIEQAHHSACLVHLGNTSYRVGQKQLMFDGATERFTNNDAANALLKPAYRKHYRISDVV